MDLSYTPEQTAFRDEVRRFLDENLPKRLSDKESVEIGRAHV